MLKMTMRTWANRELDAGIPEFSSARASLGSVVASGIMALQGTFIRLPRKGEECDHHVHFVRATSFFSVRWGKVSVLHRHGASCVWWTGSAGY